MTEWIWINGEIVPMSEARISVEDRGFQFADGVYEVIRLYHGKPFTMDRHLQRLEKSAAEIQLPMPMSVADLSAQIGKLLAKQTFEDGMIYLQLTRGAAPRAHAFAKVPPTLLFYVRELPALGEVGAEAGVKLLPLADERWKRCWIKSIALLPNVLAKNQALAAGFDEAVFIDNNIVTEGSATNVFAIIAGKLVTHPVGAKVLPGITRSVLLELAPRLEIPVQERGFSKEEALAADELFITSTTREISWVSHWGDRIVATKCGPVTMKLHRAFRSVVQSAIGS